MDEKATQSLIDKETRRRLNGRESLLNAAGMKGRAEHRPLEHL